MKKVFLLALCLSVITNLTAASLRLPHMLSNHMVLQQNTQARIWGWNDPGKKVTVTTSWDQRQRSVATDAQGNWQVMLPTPRANFTPQVITVTDGTSKLTLSDVLIGEVWVCAGQSNMEMPMRGFWGCPVEGYNEEVVKSSQFSTIRSCKLPSLMRAKPQADAQCQWKLIGPSTVADVSAVGYYFAKTLTQALNIPIGLIEANKGGSRIESWLDEDNLKKYTHEPTDSATIANSGWVDYMRPLLWGNATFHPILNYTVGGIIFYQGCSNVGAPAGHYTHLMQVLVDQWRRDFGNADLPFYFVEIAPFWHNNSSATWAADLRAQQLQAAHTIKHSGIVGTNDLVYPDELKQVHPRQKRQVGQRLAYLALHNDYGLSSLMCQCPEATSASLKGDTCILKLRYTYDGIMPQSGMQGFELQDAAGKWHKADAWRIDDSTIAVKSNSVTSPAAVSYCYRNFQLGNVHNQGSLPLMPFNLKLAR